MVTVPEWARLPVRRRRAIPLSDADAVRFALRRTTLVRLGIAALLVLLAAIAVWRAADLNPRPVAFLPAHSTSILVIDHSPQQMFRSGWWRSPTRRTRCCRRERAAQS